MASQGSSLDNLTPAQRLMQEHSSQHAHQPSVEDAQDEDDVPSTVTPSASAGLSEKAAGKQKATDSGIPNPPALNTQSEELFPSLGAPKARSAAVPPAWGKKPASVSTNGVNGTNGLSNANSRASTPASGVFTPPSVGGARGPGPQTMALPGRTVEQIEFAPSQLVPRGQLKKPISAILQDINKKSKAKVSMKEGMGGKIIFSGEGNLDAVRLALKEVANQVGSKQTVTIDIPASIRGHVVGRAGSTIQGIHKRTGAQVQLPKPSETPEDDEDATISVKIEGDPVSAEMARREIESILNDRMANVSLRVKDIPPEFYPFIAGPHNSRINDFEQGRDIRVQVPHYHQWTDQAPPSAVDKGAPVKFVSQPRQPISISGDRVAAQQARNEIDQLVAQLKRQLTVDEIPIERGRHQFIVGERGGSMHDFMEETGCSVIMPPNHEDSEVLYVVGPPDKIDNGMNKIMDLASSMSMANVEIPRQHASAPGGLKAHSRRIARYLREKQLAEELERSHNASIVLPTSIDGPDSWQIFSRDGKNTMKARTELSNLLAGHPPARLLNVDIDPFFHQHLRQNKAPQIREDHGVHVLFPGEIEDSPEVVLVFEGLAAPEDYELPRKQPTAAEIRSFERGLREAEQMILGMIQAQGEISTERIEAPSKFHEKIRRFVDREQARLTDGEFPIQMASSTGPRGRAMKLPPNTFALRGPSGAVAGMTSKVRAFIEQEKKDELERSHVTTFDFPQKFANYLIGKKGENIKKLREEFDVEIQVDNGKCELKGPPAKAAAAKSHIIALAKKLEDEATYTLKIKPQYHRDLIGRSGGQVNRLQDRYNVRIQFPRTTVADDVSEVGTDAGATRHRNQAPDEVIVKGPRRGADEAREELLNLLQWTVDNSHSATVSVAQNQIPSLIGSGGREMENMRLTTGAQIDVPNAKDTPDSAGRVEIKIKGGKSQVEAAKKMLQERSKIFDETVTKTIDVERKHHKALIGAGGSNIRDIVVAAGGPDDRRELARMVRFPRQDSDGNTIRVEGKASIVDAIIDSINKSVAERDSQVTKTLEIAPDKHRVLIGRGGDARRAIESQFGISLDVPKQNASGSARSQVKVSGQPSSVEEASAHILALVKEQEGETVSVPRALHHAVVGDNGAFFRRLRNDMRVTVDHAGQQPPPKPAAASSARTRANGAGGSLPLITDSGDDETYSWELIENDPASSAETGDIPWVLRGQPEAIAKARSQLESALETARKPSATGYLILPDPRVHRHVVGPQGSQISNIRKKTGTKVQVPRGNEQGEAIEIVGSRDGVESARDIILDLVKNAGRR